MMINKYIISIFGIFFMFVGCSIFQSENKESENKIITKKNMGLQKNLWVII